MFRTISIMNSLLLFALSFFCVVKSQVSYDLPYTGFACEDASVYYSCPRGYTIKMQSVSYGRNSTEICSDDVPDNKTIDKVCDFPQAFDMLGNICDGQNWCYFVVNDTTFPVTGCDDVYKYMDVDYICEPPIFKIDACEGDKVEFSCPSTSQYIFITNLTYGRLDDNVTCQHESIYNTSCFTHEPGLNAVTQLCGGQNSCTFMAYNKILGDPCPGTYKTLSVEYMCADCFDSFDSTECDTYQSSGHCSGSPTWMTAFCRQSCWDCQHRDECSNRYEYSELCDYWAQTGECVKDSDWMNYYCRKSCNTCNDLFKGDPEKETTTKFLCEMNIIELSCPNNYNLRIDDVHYARWNNYWCQHSSVNDSTESCPSPAGMLEKIRKVCDGRKSCYFQPRSDVFGDECPDIYKQSQITYTCQECSNAYDDIECDNKKRAGECESNNDWMFTYCFQTCTDCQKKAECDNVYDVDKSLPRCDYWAMRGDCEEQVQFMLPQCQLSCDWCAERPPIPTPMPIDYLPLKTENVCESGVKELVCPEEYTLRINDVFYGRTDNDTCHHDSVDRFNCTTPDGALEKMKALCTGRNSCFFQARSSVFGDNCPDMYKTASIDYTCQLCRNRKTDIKCQLLAEQGMCDTDYEVMMHDCYLTCSGCLYKSHKDCHNAYNDNNAATADVDCDYWAQIGECEKNPDFMIWKCMESCQKCENN